jgi:transposase
VRTITKYQPSIKASFLTKAMSLNNKGVKELAKEYNIPYSTASTWKNNMLKTQSVDTKTIAQRPANKSTEEKLKAVLATLDLSQEARGSYCRTAGIHLIHLETWEKEMLLGLEASPIQAKEFQQKNNKLTTEINELKKDLNRKDKALAEVSALLILKKKANFLWGDNEDDA